MHFLLNFVKKNMSVLLFSVASNAVSRRSSWARPSAPSAWRSSWTPSPSTSPIRCPSPNPWWVIDWPPRPASTGWPSRMFTTSTADCSHSCDCTGAVSSPACHCTMSIKTCGKKWEKSWKRMRMSWKTSPKPRKVKFTQPIDQSVGQPKDRAINESVDRPVIRSSV